VGTKKRVNKNPVLQEQAPAEEDIEVRSAIQQIVLEHRRRYGYRRVTAELSAAGCW
jgi:hypothetical protein